MLKYTEKNTPKAIPIPEQAANKIAELEEQIDTLKGGNEILGQWVQDKDKRIAELEANQRDATNNELHVRVTELLKQNRKLEQRIAELEATLDHRVMF